MPAGHQASAAFLPRASHRAHFREMRPDPDREENQQYMAKIRTQYMTHRNTTREEIIVISSDEEDNVAITGRAYNNPITLDDDEELPVVAGPMEIDLDADEDDPPLVLEELPDNWLPSDSESDAESALPLVQEAHDAPIATAVTIPERPGRNTAPDWSFVAQHHTSATKEWIAPHASEQPTAVATLIPNHMSHLEFLSALDIYLGSVLGPLDTTGSLTSSSNSFVPVRQRNHQRPQTDTASFDANLSRPYVPCLLWHQATWEDWAQLNVGDILHWPFVGWEKELFEECVEKKIISRKNRRERFADLSNDVWAWVALKLPGREPRDCQRYWLDQQNKYTPIHNKPVIISRAERNSPPPTLHNLLVERKQHGKRRATALSVAQWCNLTRSVTFGGGSGDATALAIISDRATQNIKVAAGSICDENAAYNVQGNLRIWSSKNDSVSQLRGHKTTCTLPDSTEQAIWRSVIDVKVSPDSQLIYSASHDEMAKVWCAKTGRMLSTLCFHEKPLHQLAVKTDTTDHILASCSLDGSAVIWRINAKGNVGAGSVCDLNQSRSNPSIECVEFGHGRSANKLFLGVNKKDITDPGMIQSVDIETAELLGRYTSMKGSVCAMAISRTGGYLVSGNYSSLDEGSGDKMLHVHSLTNNEPSVIRAMTGHADVNVVGISPCERYIASGSPANETVVIDLRRPDHILHRLLHDRQVQGHLAVPDTNMGITGLYWMSNSRLMVTGGGDSTIKLWDVWNGQLLKSYAVSNDVTSLAVDEDSMTLVAGAEGAQGVVHVWRP